MFSPNGCWSHKLYTLSNILQVYNNFLFTVTQVNVVKRSMGSFKEKDEVEVRRVVEFHITFTLK